MTCKKKLLTSGREITRNVGASLNFCVWESKFIGSALRPFLIILLGRKLALRANAKRFS